MKVIMYHYVRPIDGSSYPNLKGLELNGFRRQLDFFANNFHIINEQEVLEVGKKGNKLDKDFIWLTFDDGYKDHFNYVLPELKRRNIQASFFPPAEPLKEKTLLDVNSIHFILERVNNPKKIMNLLEDQLKSEGFNAKDIKYMWDSTDKSSRFDSEEIIFFKRCLQSTLTKELRTKIIENIFKEILDKSMAQFSEELYMSPRELLELQKEGMSVGIHGYKHEWLNKMNYDDQKKDLIKAKTYLSEIGINLDNSSVCYPYGGYNADTLKLAEELNFSLGLTTKVGITRDEDLKNKFEIPRLDTNDFPQ